MPYIPCFLCETLDLIPCKGMRRIRVKGDFNQIIEDGERCPCPLCLNECVHPFLWKRDIEGVMVTGMVAFRVQDHTGRVPAIACVAGEDHRELDTEMGWEQSEEGAASFFLDVLIHSICELN
jgi:hypothetical protein